MSNLDPRPQETLCGGAIEDGAPVRQLIPGREVQIGPRNTLVTRTLPSRTRRTVGAWCFVDHFGPEDIHGTAGMQVPPHPHCGLQTVTWLVAGEALHRDSLGNAQLIRPGELNLMTAGRGISHSEESPAGHGDLLHGVQLWVALPGTDRSVAPDFEHLNDLPVLTEGDARITVIVGSLAGSSSRATRYSPLLAVEVTLPDPDPGADVTLPLEPGFEHAALTLSGTAAVDGDELPPGPLLYLGTGRRELAISGRPAADGQPARMLLLGGEPLAEQLVMWWNFVGRDHDEIAQARADWAAERRFGTVHGYAGGRLPAPPLPNARLTPR